MLDWTDEQKMLRDAIRSYVDKEIVPLRDELEHGDLPPYEVLRKMFTTFGIDEMARDGFNRRLERDVSPAPTSSEPRSSSQASGFDPALMLILLIELSRHCPGMVTALGVSVGLTASAIDNRGTPAQRERWVPNLLTLDRIGAWALTEPGSGSDAFGAMRASARRDGDDYILNGSKTFITNGPYADTVVFICKLDEGDPIDERKIVSFVLDRGMPGLEQSRPLRKMGMHSSPTGEIFVSDLRAGRDRLIGETEDSPTDARDGAKGTFATERAGVAAMALGIIEQCQSLCVEYANDRVQFGQPIGQFQLIQDKLARMEIARLNVSNLVFRYIEAINENKPLSLAEASAMKLYSARAATDVALEAVQLFGGNGYMAEFGLEQLARDAKALQIYGGTDELQITHIARGLLSSKPANR
ncbi:acyl-CoA dehydrogenase family protein [Ilumatobacter sp.]|uniref:acyl-CoA dehydrogenase family protein n=1 Tax=Ilumatobacter sp. TaxID=1967498 RepID=UPI003AF440F4